MTLKLSVILTIKLINLINNSLECFHDIDHGYIFRNPYQNYKFDENDLKLVHSLFDFISFFQN